MNSFSSNHFHCFSYYGRNTNYEPHDEYLVAVCSDHPIFSDYAIEEKSCNCHELGPFDICADCVNVRYVLNFVAKKVCFQIYQMTSKI